MASDEESVESILADLKQYVINVEDFHLGKVIGRGGYGDVFLATHAKTGKQCALKKLHVDNLVGRDLQFFCREVKILAKCQNSFFLPLIGFSWTPPYVIATEFIPNGTLFDALHHKSGSPRLNSTQKTKIAIFIAKGMIILHSFGIIHRDLKSLNILLDSSLLPKISDFGVARFVSDESSLVTKDVGTPHFMAPELFETNNYTNKVDVYAYGVMLWEMQTEVIPFKGKTPAQVALAVCKNSERPPIPRETPSNLTSLITACWDQNPDNRPSFSDIFERFHQPKMCFRGADRAQIALLLKDLDAYKSGDLVLSDPSAPLSLPSQKLPQILPQSQPISQPSKPFSRGNIFLEISEIKPLIFPSIPTSAVVLQTYSDPGFVPSFQLAVACLKPEAAKTFFQTISVHFSSKLPRDVGLFILSELAALFQKTPEFIHAFIEVGLHLKLPFRDPSYFNSVVSILATIARRSPTSVSSDMIKKAISMAQTFPKEVTFLFSNVSVSFRKIESTILDYFIGVSGELIQRGCGSSIVRIVYFLQSSYPEFNASHAKYCYLIYLRSLYSPEVRTIRQALGALCQTYEPGYSVPLDLLVKFLKNICLQKKAISYLIRVPTLEASEDLIDGLVNIVQKNSGAVLLLCRLCENESGARLLLNKPSWMDDELVPIEISMQLLMTIFSQPQMRNRFSEVHEFIPFLLRLCNANDSKVPPIICTILRRMTINEGFLKKLAESRFLETFISITTKAEDTSVVNACFLLVDTLARVGFCEEFMELIPLLPKFFDSTEEVVAPALVTALLLSAYPQTHDTFRKHGILNILKKMTFSQAIDKFRVELISKISE